MEPSESARQQPQVIVIAEQKSLGVALLLTILFGPLGLLYATPMGGLLLLCITFVVGVLTLGFGLFLGWIAAIVWSVVAVGQHNERMMALAARAR